MISAIEERLTYEPLTLDRNRNPLDPGFIPGFHHVPPVWELRVGDVRVYYDVDEAEGTVLVRATPRWQGDQGLR